MLLQPAVLFVVDDAFLLDFWISLPLISIEVPMDCMVNIVYWFYQKWFW